MAAAHKEELEELTTRTFNYVPRVWGGKKTREENWQQMLAQDKSFPAEKKNKATYCTYWMILLIQHARKDRTNDGEQIVAAGGRGRKGRRIKGQHEGVF